MSRRSNGGPAFPCQWENPGDLNATAPDGQIVHPGGTVSLQGMTLRDYFAAKAMQAALSYPSGGSLEEFALNAKFAYMAADAMLKAREA